MQLSARSFSLKSLVVGIVVVGLVSIAIVIYSQWLVTRDFHRNTTFMRVVQSVQQEIATAHPGVSTVEMWGYAGGTLQTSRGCPYRCTYCSQIGPRRWRGRSVDSVVAEWRWLVRDLGVAEIGVLVTDRSVREMLGGEIRGHELEDLRIDLHLGQIYRRHAILPGQKLCELRLGQRTAGDQREADPGPSLLLFLEGLIQLLPRDEILTQQQFADLALFHRS